MSMTTLNATDQAATTMNFAKTIVARGTGTASISFSVPSANSRPKTQLITRRNRKNAPAAAIIDDSPMYADQSVAE